MAGPDFAFVVNSVVESHAQDLWDLSRFLCENPELALEEVKAHDKLCEFLEHRGFTVERQHLLRTAFRAEFSAPGGSDEELHGGKDMLLKKGAFTDVTVAMMAHPVLQDILRIATTATQQIKVEFNGKGTHAAASPWHGVNALDAAVASYVNVSLLRQQIKPTCRIHGIIVEGGTYPNIIPETSKLVYQIRGATAQDLDELVTRVEGCLRSAAEATGCTVKTETVLHYKDFVHNVALTKVYRKHWTSIG
ncbi:hypothetical protein HPB48_022596 [Haemaphysalis longicornis]|uniref:Peptidase M20 dimerisation domain-containing protein n=1 Tax=Haemaphysalis longicornis TaxID=44386 RepID=A0A9J6GL95_HAELO|nr:hypothetical protein HPB48_022596 [Haemaphysalis longicornis]